jgi:bifunctional UDP-N-acetylglucosamine pyrophosphorylase/glucosamine-1-phosphate N-acetyltransferase
MNIRDRVDLAEAESMFRIRINAAWLLKGVTMLDPDHTDVDASVTLDADVTLFPGAHSRVGSFAVLEPG